MLNLHTLRTLDTTELLHVARTGAQADDPLVVALRERLNHVLTVVDDMSAEIDADRNRAYDVDYARNAEYMRTLAPLDPRD